MYPPQTSLIPVAVALARFLGEKGLSALTSSYPYWYLGTTPYGYLTGPVIPILSVLVKKIASGATYFDIEIVLVLASCLASSVGWSLLVARIKEEKINLSSFAIYFLLFAVLPWKYLNGLALAEPSAFIAEMLIPYVFLAVAKNRYLGIISVLTVLLISTNVLPVLIVGMAVLALTGSFTGGKLKKWKESVKRSIIILIFGLALATFYYTPGFWLTVLVNPSVGGVPGVKAMLSLIGMARNAIPILLAFIVIYLSRRIPDKISFFGWAWVLVFAFLTVWRALGNIHFWMDWISWFGEIEIGLGILIAANLKNLRRLFLLVLPFLATFLVFNAIGKPVLITKSPPPEITSISKLAGLAGGSLVFTSGTGVFWLNAFYNTPQVRGGRDEVSVSSMWLPVSYALREGTDEKVISQDLGELGISYILVNSYASYDYYHDYKNVNLWDSVAKAVWQGSGDVIYVFK